MKLLCNKCYHNTLTVHEYDDKIYVDPCHCNEEAIEDERVLWEQEAKEELEDQYHDAYSEGYDEGYEDGFDAADGRKE